MTEQDKETELEDLRGIVAYCAVEHAKQCIKLDQATTKEEELIAALEAIAIPDGDIGTMIFDSELDRCQSLAKAALLKHKGE